MNSPNPRPLSPHLGIYKWGPHMLVSILHRMTGAALTIGGLGLLTWWLSALSGGKYAAFTAFLNWEISDLPLVIIALVALTWAFWQHLFTGLRHLFLDIGAGFELHINKFWSVMTLVGSIAATAVTFYVLKGAF